jgi:signal transduction histidine kinase
MTEACTGFALLQAAFRDQFFAMVAHDLRNPLNTALTTAQLIRQVPAAQQVPQWADRVIDNIRRVDRMVHDILDALHVQIGGRLQLDLEECDLVEIARATLEHLKVQHGDRLVLVASQPVPGYFAPDDLRRALENLVTNAVKYGATSGPITVTVRQEYERAVLSVHNDGEPIPDDQKETLFRAFQRATAPQTSDKRGWGLGLAQVRAVAEAHGGSIIVDSTSATGTTFTIDVPLDARPYQQSPTWAAPAPHQ